MLTIKTFVFSPIQENTYVIYNESRDCFIIDPGCYDDDEKEALRSFIETNSLNVKLLLNTHCHLDHVFGNAFVASQYGLELYMHREENQVLDFAPAAGLMYNLPFENYTGERKYLEDGDTITLGTSSFEVIFTPGHSPGSISFYCAKEGILISGDVLFNRSIGRSDLPGGNQKILLNSIRTRLFVLPENTQVFSGHGPVTIIGEEKRENPFLNGQDFFS